MLLSSHRDSSTATRHTSLPAAVSLAMMDVMLATIFHRDITAVDTVEGARGCWYAKVVSVGSSRGWRGAMSCVWGYVRMDEGVGRACVCGTTLSAAVSWAMVDVMLATIFHRDVTVVDTEGSVGVCLCE